MRLKPSECYGLELVSLVHGKNLLGLLLPNRKARFGDLTNGGLRRSKCICHRRNYDAFCFLCRLFPLAFITFFFRRLALLPFESVPGRAIATKFSPTAFSLNSPRPPRSK